MSKEDKSAAAKEIGCEFFPLFDLSSFAKVIDVVVVWNKMVHVLEVVLTHTV